MGRTRTWLLRGVAVAVFAALVAAWAVGLAGFGGTAASIEKPPNTVESTDGTPGSDRLHSSDREKAKPRRTREARPSGEGLADPTPAGTDEPSDADPSTPNSPSTSPTSDSPSEDPTNSPPPSQSPNNPPSNPPGDQCTDLGSTIDCALDPVTGRP